MKPHIQKASRLFARIAPLYDLWNTIISFGLHKVWRRQALQALEVRPGQLCLDVAAGTGAFSLALRRRGAYAIALDITPEMLRIARRREPALPAVLADALALPFPAATFDRIIVGFGLRHVKEDLPLLLAELRRVLKPTGRCVILELSHPPHRLWRSLFKMYLHFLLPLIGSFVDREAYAYLEESLRGYPSAEELAAQFRQAGFAECSYQLLTGGVVAIHQASALPQNHP